MSQFYAVSISISQGAFDCQARASLCYTDERTDTIMNIEWPDMPPQTDPENPGEWLFHCLEDLVSNFDAHAVTGAERKPRTDRQGR